MVTAQQNSSSVRNSHRATHVLAATLAILAGVGSLEHGLLECMQGWAPTQGPLVNALGRGYSWTTWKDGGEGAFTLLPNFLSSGIAASLLGVLMIAWALRGIRLKHGPIIFLGLGTMSFLTGGGVAQVVLILLTWSIAWLIHSPLMLWNRFFPPQFLKALGKIWPCTLFLSVALFLVALEIAIFGYVPGITDPVKLLHTCWSVLATALTMCIISVCSGLAHDNLNAGING